MVLILQQVRVFKLARATWRHCALCSLTRKHSGPHRSAVCMGSSPWDESNEERERGHWEHNPFPQDNAPRPDNPEGVPTWAAPHETPPAQLPPRSTESSTPGYTVPRWDNTTGGESSVGMNATGTPDDPNKVPVNGGLGLLLAAGLGYGAHRLRTRSGDSEDSGRS